MYHMNRTGHTVFMNQHITQSNRVRMRRPNQKNNQNLLSLLLFYFFTASAGGYIWELLLFLVKDHVFVNRGFLYGPWLPVYGLGAVFFYLLLGRLQKKPILAFFWSLLIGTGLELSVGFFLERVWSLHYWDYSEYFLNFQGWICLWSAVGFGTAGMIWICVLSGPLRTFWFSLQNGFRRGLDTILFLLFLTDCCAALIFPNIGSGITF